MPDDGSGHNDKNDLRQSLVERAMQGARQDAKARGGDQPIPDVRAEDVLEASSQAGPEKNRPEPDVAVPALPDVADPERIASKAAEQPEPEPSGGVPDRLIRSQAAEVDLERLQRLGFIAPNQSRTRTTEEFRLIKRAVLQRVTAARSEGRRNPNIIMVTSAEPSEGKTFNAINLAISIASEPDLNVLLIDADLINPSVFMTLGLESEDGLVDLIEQGGDFNLANYMVRTNLGRLTLLGAGTPHPMATELMASERMRRFVDEVSQRYNDRIVIFDAPPILATSEASVLTEHMSQIVFVVEADRTSRNQAREALDLIGNGPSVGIVLNKASSRFGTRIMSSYYKSYSKS